MTQNELIKQIEAKEAIAEHIVGINQKAMILEAEEIDSILKATQEIEQIINR